MEFEFINNETQGRICLIQNKKEFQQYFHLQKKGFTTHTIAWNRGTDQIITIDETDYLFKTNTIIPLMNNQSFSFEQANHIVAWQFNREFYCIVNHDAEVGCVGFLFFGPSPVMFIEVDEEYNTKLTHLIEIFEDEFKSDELVKNDMLRMLLTRLIIHVTRLAKKQHSGEKEIIEDKFNVLRQFNLLVEIHFKKEHQLGFYANLLHKSPKTISNYFSLYSKKTPLQIIQDRIITEAKRLFYYTDKSVKEIAEELGFKDSSHFSKFFKKCTSNNPTDLKKPVIKESKE